MAILPYPTLKKNQVYGWGGGVSLVTLYRFNKKDTVTPPQMSVFQPVYFQNKSYYFAFYSKNYFKKDKIRNVFLLYNTRLNFQFYVQNVFPEVLDYTGYVPYTSKAIAFIDRLEFRLKGDFFLGGQINVSRKKLSVPNENLEAFLKELDSLAVDRLNPLSLREVGIGISMRYDTRDNILNPTKGVHFYANNFTYSDLIGSEANFTAVNTECSYYYNLKRAKIVLASKVTFNMNFGDVPFVDQEIMGYGGEFKSDLRGYNKGQFRGDHLMAIQVEQRWNFYRRWSFNAFFGVGTAFSKSGEIPVLTAGGGGFRFMAIPRFKFNLGVDVAAGKDDHGVYFSIGQAF